MNGWMANVKGVSDARRMFVKQGRGIVRDRNVCDVAIVV